MKIQNGSNQVLMFQNDVPPLLHHRGTFVHAVFSYILRAYIYRGFNPLTASGSVLSALREYSAVLGYQRSSKFIEKSIECVS